MGGAFHDTQRQLASAEYAVQTGRVPNEVAAHYALVGSLEPQTVPYVPRAVIQKQGHREKVAVNTAIYPACVARKVPRSEWSKPAPLKALDDEWNRLRTMPWPDGKGKGTWDESKVASAKAIRKQCDASGKVAHVSRIFQLLYEPGSELTEGDPRRQ